MAKLCPHCECVMTLETSESAELHYCAHDDHWDIADCECRDCECHRSKLSSLVGTLWRLCDDQLELTGDKLLERQLARGLWGNAFHGVRHLDSIPLNGYLNTGVSTWHRVK